ncbi:MAG: hypothetical protein R2747_17040 [Pyrinomonadaceae bacterium]
MKLNYEKEMPESGTAFALLMALMNGLVLTIGAGLFWLVQIILTQPDQISRLVHGFFPY